MKETILLTVISICVFLMGLKITAMNDRIDLLEQRITFNESNMDFIAGAIITNNSAFVEIIITNNSLINASIEELRREMISQPYPVYPPIQQYRTNLLFYVPGVVKTNITW